MRQSASGPDQFAVHIAPHLEALFRLAYRLLRNTSDAQDLVQDTCLSACGRLQEVAATDSPRKWLLTVLHNRFIDGQRRRNRSPLVPAEEVDDLDEIPSEDFDPRGAGRAVPGRACAGTSLPEAERHRSARCYPCVRKVTNCLRSRPSPASTARCSAPG